MRVAVDGVLRRCKVSGTDRSQMKLLTNALTTPLIALRIDGDLSPISTHAFRSQEGKGRVQHRAPGAKYRVAIMTSRVRLRPSRALAHAARLR
jgi:hypothetical protein